MDGAIFEALPPAEAVPDPRAILEALQTGPLVAIALAILILVLAADTIAPWKGPRR